MMITAEYTEASKISRHISIQTIYFTQLEGIEPIAQEH